MDKELNQLYALLAVRLGNARAALIKGLYAAWQQEPERGLPTRAVESGVVPPEQSALLVAMVKQAVQSQGGNAAAALQRLGGEGALRHALAGRDGTSADRFGPWLMPITVAAVVIAALSVVVMGSGWYSAASDRVALHSELSRLEDGYQMFANEITHLRQVNEMTEEKHQRAVRALADAEDELSHERRLRREATARTESPLPDAPPTAEEAAQAAAQPLQWRQPNQAPQQPVTLDGQQFEQYTRNLDPMSAVAQLSPQFPTDAQGRTLGISSNNFSSLPLARQLGLQNGDIISNINGVNITGLGSYGAIEQAVRRGGPITVTILRNGQPLTATFNLR